MPISIYTVSISGGVQKGIHGQRPEIVFFVGPGVLYARADSKTRWQHCKQQLKQRAANVYLTPIEALNTNTNGAAQEGTNGKSEEVMLCVLPGVQYVLGASKILWRRYMLWPGKRAVNALQMSDR